MIRGCIVLLLPGTLAPDAAHVAASFQARGVRELIGQLRASDPEARTRAACSHAARWSIPNRSRGSSGSARMSSGWKKSLSCSLAWT